MATGSGVSLAGELAGELTGVAADGIGAVAAVLTQTVSNYIYT